MARLNAEASQSTAAVEAMAAPKATTQPATVQPSIGAQASRVPCTRPVMNKAGIQIVMSSTEPQIPTQAGVTEIDRRSAIRKGPSCGGGIPLD
jgi:hypothetical protein